MFEIWNDNVEICNTQFIKSMPHSLHIHLQTLTFVSVCKCYNLLWIPICNTILFKLAKGNIINTIVITTIL